MAKKNTSATISQLIREISLAQRRANNQQLSRTTSVTDQQVMILSLIAKQPGLIQKDIVDVTHRRAATVSALLKKLENEELIIRQIPTTNSRNKELFLTEAGQQLVTEFDQIRAQTEQQLTTHLSAKQQSKLIALLTEAQRGLTD